MSGRTLLTLSALALAVLAKRDLAGCTSIATTNQWGHASMLYYLPGTGEICELLDCGGGRAPVKYDTPGCAGNPYVPKFLPNYNPATQTPEATPEATPAPETPAEEEEEEEPTYEDEYEVEPVEPSSSVPSQTAAPEYPAETPSCCCCWIGYVVRKCCLGYGSVGEESNDGESGMLISVDIGNIRFKT
ncbi:hypothetical protein M011DRAFT_117832 [Sporormia fimetaria CBS 119925]|uniref:Uncharacterized protein n=1 Tax=Sporormia fimetaria CBS 119925 TaxID=1340428 RepID=A0A6A6VQG8_9PLEO|nr:hypothetical protein M011DRAFT_117832 [Sporormia fimetaria CBS 119925]